jgi:hypothetical protein
MTLRSHGGRRVQSLISEVNLMKREPTKKPRPKEASEAEIQQGDGRGISKEERLKRIVKQHPQREEPKVDSVEPGETPAP